MGKRITRWYVNVRLDCDARFSEEAVTKAFSGCEELEVEASESMFRSGGNGCLLLFRNVRGVGKAKVSGSVVRAFASWLEQSMMSEPGTKIGDYAEASYEVWSHTDR